MNLFINENTSQNIVCEMASILSRGRRVNASGASLSDAVEPFSEHDYCTKTPDVTMTNAGYRSSHKLLFLDT